MAATLRAVLTAVNEPATIACPLLATVGLRLSGTWVGTVQVLGSFDGVNFNFISASPFPTGAAVASITANGNYFVPVGNYVAIQVLASAYTSGNIGVTMIASADSSYQNAFITPALLNPSSSATNATNTLTVAANTNGSLNLTSLVVTVSGQPAWLTSPNLTISDGATPVWSIDLPLSGSSGVIYNVPLPPGGIANTPGNTLVIVVPAAGSNITTRINASVTRG